MKSALIGLRCPALGSAMPPSPVPCPSPGCPALAAWCLLALRHVPLQGCPGLAVWRLLALRHVPLLGGLSRMRTQPASAPRASVYLTLGFRTGHLSLAKVETGKGASWLHGSVPGPVSTLTRSQLASQGQLRPLGVACAVFLRGDLHKPGPGLEDTLHYILENPRQLLHCLQGGGRDLRLLQGELASHEIPQIWRHTSGHAGEGSGPGVVFIMQKLCSLSE